MNNLLAYLPSYITRDLIEHPDTNPLEHERRFEAVGLFADISGFTQLSETLGRKGLSGTEELTTILNTFFEDFIKTIYSYGGVVGNFGGDALSVLFEITDSKAETTMRAIRCALDLQTTIQTRRVVATADGSIQLDLKVGLASGRVFCSNAGYLKDPQNSRLGYITAGEVIDRCAAAEHHAVRGEVVAHESLLEDLSQAQQVHIEKEAHGEKFWRLKSLQIPVTPLPSNSLPEPPDAIQPYLAAYLHPALFNRIAQGYQGFLNEHRHATILFVCFEGLDYEEDPHVKEKLQLYLSEVFNIVQKYDGYLNKIDMGDKGSKFLLLFGAPVAHEDDEARALRCAMELTGSAYQYVNQMRIGVNSGKVYCGLVGSDLRREYTVMGDAVNLAARLMQAARPAQILVSAQTTLPVQERFDWDELPPFSVKGKSAPVIAYGLVDAKDEERVELSGRLEELEYTLPMVGRQKELAKIKETLVQVKAGQGQTLAITGEAGMGKSRLNAELIKLALAEGFEGYTGEAPSYGANIPYIAWHNLLRSFFGLAPGWKFERVVRHLTMHLAGINPSPVPRLPLLGAALNLPIPENNLTAPMEAKLRKASLEALLVDCLRARATQKPMLLVLEDSHWQDQLSRELLNAVAFSCSDIPLLLVMLYRTPESEAFLEVSGTAMPSEKSPLAHLPNFTELRLNVFTTEEAEELIRLKAVQCWSLPDTREVRVPPGFSEKVRERAQGNPFYIDELVNLIRDKEIDLADTVALERLALPDNLNRLIISRIDQLQEEEKLTLKIASVVGRLFKASWLWGISPELGDQEKILTQLNHLSKIEITPLDKPHPELEYLFKHILTREVVYNSLALSTRATLHEQIGFLIERLYPDTLEQFNDLLAHHYGNSRNREKQRHYFERAGDAAAASYANQAALSYYRQLLPLVESAEAASVQLKLGSVQELVSNWAEAGQCYEKALALFRQDGNAGGQGQALLAVGTLWVKQKNLMAARPRLEQALEAFELAGAVAEQGRALAELGEINRLAGAFEEARDCYRRSLLLVEQLPEGSARMRLTARILKAQSTAFAQQGALEEARRLMQEAHALQQSLGNKPEVAILTSNMAIIASIVGEKAVAENLFSQSLLLQRELGNRWSEAQVLNNLGQLKLEQGLLESARTNLEQSLSLARKLGDEWGIAQTLSTLGNTLLALGATEEARRVLRESLGFMRQTGEKLGLIYLLEFFAGLAALEKRAEPAFQLAGAAAQMRGEAEIPASPEEMAELEQRLNRVRTDTGRESEVAAFQQGRELRLEVAVQLALSL
jgi:class 3 adenylate cyclase/predicted ATPase